MECFIAEPTDIDREGLRLSLHGDEAHHVRVLRLRAGEKLLATDLVGSCFLCRLSEVVEQGRSELIAYCTIEEIVPEFGEPKNDVALIQGLIAQPARWEWLLEKATELGIRSIRPVLTERTEKTNLKLDRADRVLRAAVKQTKRARMPVLQELSSLAEALSEARSEGRTIILLHEAVEPDDSLQQALARIQGSEKQAIALVVGPEGGFSNEEVELATTSFGAITASLGARRLRAETAAIAAITLAVQG